MNLVDLAASANAASAGTQGLRQKQDSSCNSTDEALALRKEVAELNEVERLSEEKKKHLNLLKIRADDVEKLCSRVNVLRHEIKEKEAENNLLKKDKEEVESTVQNLKEDNIQLKNLRDEYRSQSANMKSVIEEKERKISAVGSFWRFFSKVELSQTLRHFKLIEQSEADKRKILRLDTDLAIAMIDRIQNESA
ncbi:unnamed protein product [Nippostrongylus brasiliensis]|uniref:RAB6-interacting golgin n=1 Tax=Nippostrongylus brasiliensis TaxID=27835 RepID=A0A0N4XI51_NIPBR|nr:unnamed protein product [Nippostrongylus brasiliensis]